MGVGLKGVILDDFKLTLDGDTFDIRGRIGDSLLIVLNSNQDDKTPYYLLKYERNGFYYPQIGASDISTIDHTNNYVIIALKQYRLYHSNDTASLAWLQVSLFTWLAIPV